MTTRSLRAGGALTSRERGCLAILKVAKVIDLNGLFAAPARSGRLFA
jgi:hypothetical protein